MVVSAYQMEKVLAIYVIALLDIVGITVKPEVCTNVYRVFSRREHMTPNYDLGNIELGI